MIKDALKIARIHLDRLEKSVEEMKEFEDLEKVNFGDFEVIKTNIYISVYETSGLYREQAF
jgi:hypothetical protein